MKEIYKPINNYENLYEVSNKGTIRALPRYNIDKNGKKKFYPGKNLKYDKSINNHTTYYRVTLSKDGKTKKFLVHRLVAEHFIPTEDLLLHVNHIDNNGTNNNVSNLEWVTHSENMLHAQKQNRLFVSQQKGGKAAGKKQAAKAKEAIEAMIGTRSGLWEVIGYYGKKGTKHHALCKCHGCDSEILVYNYSIKNKRSLGCKSCVTKKMI